ncbi:hypothetical protein IWQ56_006397 [Coemansia nantahalensis]|nr:hypothetical protein IWQ56_006397 [Coemansia nantahalensis]
MPAGDGLKADLLGQRVTLRYVQREAPPEVVRKPLPRFVAVEGKERQAGIGGYGSITRKSGIGNHVPGHRDSGIGKLCFDENGGWLTKAASSIRRLSFGNRRRNSAPANVLPAPDRETQSPTQLGTSAQSVNVSVHEDGLSRATSDPE